jgi:hypothetical protein
MKITYSYVYTRLDDIEVEDEPEVKSEQVAVAIEAIANIEDLLGPATINLDILKADPTGYTYLFTSLIKIVDQQHTQVQLSNNEWYVKAGCKKQRYSLYKY